MHSYTLYISFQYFTFSAKRTHTHTQHRSQTTVLHTNNNHTFQH